VVEDVADGVRGDVDALTLKLEGEALWAIAGLLASLNHLLFDFRWGAARGEVCGSGL